MPVKNRQFIKEEFQEKCRQVRIETMEIVRHGRRGHIGGAFSMVEILVTLYDYFLNFIPTDPNYEERDRFILSKGHCCPSWYAILAEKGFFSREELKKFCSFDGILGGHPTKEKVPGCEASTGSLGHGLSIGVGFAKFAKLENKKFKTYVLLGDGECNEGSVWEAALSASKNKLDNLVVLVDYNKYQSFGSTKKVCDLDPLSKKWESFGFETRDVNLREDPFSLYEVLNSYQHVMDKPLAIVCHTIKGQGIARMEGNLEWHHKSKINDEEIDSIIDELKRK